ncbi:unnamed protein product [Ambrosiozyma monospora]|uniref:Unnamed protein product n=1 Tax=Ambrosiozyma monospora TaxID=43982 RepID=A0ACB5U915_AMBMO|nr:unnamed protein product [Ambrosiozyma monospora]
MVSALLSRFNMNACKFLNSFWKKERIVWKQIHGKPVYLQNLIYATMDEQKIHEMSLTIVNNLLPHCEALIERVLYFGDHLNDLVYGGAIDMLYVYECFNKLFPKIPTVHGGYKFTFVKPEKTCDYAFLSLVLSVVSITFPFSEYDQGSFKTTLPPETKEIVSSLSTQALAASQFKRKESYAALMSLIIIKDIHYAFSKYGSDSMDETKSAQMFYEIMNIAMDLGIHREPSTINDIMFHLNAVYHLPPLNSRAVWSHLKVMDANYAVILGRPLMVNDQFADASLSSVAGSDIQASFIELQRDTATLINSVDVISMNDILRLRDRQIALNNSLGTFHKLIEPDPA